MGPTAAAIVGGVAGVAVGAAIADAAKPKKKKIVYEGYAPPYAPGQYDPYFNQAYSPTFTVPEPWFGTAGKRIMSLQDPSAKMSKSDENPNGFISMLDEPGTIVKKFKRAVTDSETEVRYDKDAKPGVSNLMEIYGCATGASMEAVEREFAGKGYGDFKTAVGEAVAESLRPIQDEFKRLMADKGELEAVMVKGAGQASRIAGKTLSKVRRKVGFVTPKH